MPTLVRIEEKGLNGVRDIHEVEIGSTDMEDDVARRTPPPPLSQASATVQTDPSAVRLPTSDPSPGKSPPSPLVQNAPTPTPISEGIGTDVAFEGLTQLVTVDQYVQFRTDLNTQIISGVFDIANISRDKRIVIFKLKTTSQSKFVVGPTIGIIHENAVARVTIKARESETMESIKNDSFLIQAMILPLQYYNLFSTSESDSGDAAVRNRYRISLNDFPRLSSLWKEVADVRGTYVEEHRMASRITRPPPPEIVLTPPRSLAPQPWAEPQPTRLPTPSPEPVSMSEPTPAPELEPIHHSNFELFRSNENDGRDFRRRLTAVHDQVTNSTDTIETRLEWITLLVYGLYILIVLAVLLFLWVPWYQSSSSSSASRPPNIMPPPAPNVEAEYKDSAVAGDGTGTTFGHPIRNSCYII